MRKVRLFKMNTRERIDSPRRWRRGERVEIEELVAKMAKQKPVCPCCGNPEIGVLPAKPYLIWDCPECGNEWCTDWNLKEISLVEKLVKELLEKVGKLAAGSRRFRGIADNFETNYGEN